MLVVRASTSEAEPTTQRYHSTVRHEPLQILPQWWAQLGLGTKGFLLGILNDRYRPVGTYRHLRRFYRNLGLMRQIAQTIQIRV